MSGTVRCDAADHDSFSVTLSALATLPLMFWSASFGGSPTCRRSRDSRPDHVPSSNALAVRSRLACLSQMANDPPAQSLDNTQDKVRFEILPFNINYPSYSH